MKKIFLILLLCSPLGWVAWEESRSLLKDFTEPVVIDSADDDLPDGEKPAQTKVAKAKADEVLNLSEELVRSAVALEDPPEGSESGSVATEVANAGRLRRERRKDVEKEQDKAADLVKNIEDNLIKLRGEDGRPHLVPASARAALERDLKEYELLDVRDTDRIESANAEKEWPKLDLDNPRGELDQLYERLDRWTPESPDGEVQETVSVKSHADKYRDYLDKYGKVKDPFANALVKEARERYELWSRGAVLVAVIKDRKSNTPDRSPIAGAGRVNTIAEQAVAENVPDKFVATARRLARVFSADMLPEEKLDENVVLSDGGVPRPVDRTKLLIAWKDGGESKTLDKSGFNEFNLKVDNVAGFVFNNESFDPPTDNSPPLTPTDYSKAINAYNARRARVKRWSSEDLVPLREVAQQNSDVLVRDPRSSGRNLLERIDALNKVVSRYPVLFSNDSN